jgi:hypothetical protein
MFGLAGEDGGMCSEAAGELAACALGRPAARATGKPGWP